MLTGGDPLEDESIDESTGEAHSNTGTRNRIRRHDRWNRVVEGSVEVREGDIDRDPGDRVVDRLVSGSRGSHGPDGARPHRRRGNCCSKLAQAPAAARNASTRSVRSQVKSGSSRPKCP
jgi:hypothetical protein